MDYKTELTNLAADIQSAIDKTNALPNAGGGSEDLDSVLTEQEELIVSLQKILDTKASGSDGGHRVRYIESSGMEAIDTGISIEETDAIECDFELLDLSASGDKMLFGVVDAGGGIWAETYGNSNNWYVRFGHTSSVSISWNQYQTAGTIRLEKGKAILNGASAVTLGYTSLPTLSCVLFARKTTSGDYGGKRAMRSFGFRIIAASGLPKINLVPWVTDAGDVGMRDLVTGAFFGNVAAEGAFVASSY